MKKNPWIMLVVVCAALLAWNQVDRQAQFSDQPAADNGAIAQAFRERTSDLMVSGRGIVEKTLADDNSGSRHQRFVLGLPSGQSILIAHNIDLAPRIAALRVGDAVAFNGEYEWNPQGGVVHWTHHDPEGRHEAGWLEHNGRRYQ